MIGMHRGRRGLRWRLVSAVIAAALGRGYAGRHRLEAAALGLPVSGLEGHTAVARAATSPASVPQPAISQLKPSGTCLTLASGGRLTVVPVVTSPNPLVDTVPHPVVKMFPLPVEDAVFADVDQVREEQAVADLAAGSPPSPHGYHGRHSA